MDAERRQQLERLARRGSLAAIPLILVAAWWFGRPAQDGSVAQDGSQAAVRSEAVPAASAGQAPAPSASMAAVPSARAGARIPATASNAPHTPPPSTTEQAERGESALEFDDTPQPVAAPPPPVVPAGPRHQVAADLPEHVGTAATAPSRPEPPSACGGLVVRLITAAEDQDWAFATISKGFDQPAKIRRVGDTVGNWRVASIEWDRVWVQAGGSRCAVGMHLGAREAHAQVTEQPELGVIEVTEPAPAWALPPEIAAGIFERSVTEFDIEAAVVDALFARGADVFAGVRFTPVYELERLVALELNDIRVDSLLERLNVESRDRVVSIGGRPITTPEDALVALDESRRRGELVAILQRDGERFELHVRSVTR